MTNGKIGTSKCEKCGNLMGDLVYERKNILVCRKCADKIDGKQHKELEVDDNE